MAGQGPADDDVDGDDDDCDGDGQPATYGKSASRNDANCFWNWEWILFKPNFLMDLNVSQIGG